MNMLVLTRKLMEKLIIGDNVVVTVVRIENGQVRLGIEAPHNIAVIRSELCPQHPALCASKHFPPRGPSFYDPDKS